MFGDNNSRTKNIRDFIPVDDFVFDSINLPEISEEFLLEMKYFENTNISTQRNNCDKTSNNYGAKFTEFLQENNFYILNGRTVGDLLGQFTCNDVSVIDYFICSGNFFHLVDNLTVNEFCPLLSDVHCSVSLGMKLDPRYQCTCKTQDSNEPPMWNNNLAESFKTNLHYDELNDLDSNLNHVDDRNQFL